MAELVEPLTYLLIGTLLCRMLGSPYTSRPRRSSFPKKYYFYCAGGRPKRSMVVRFSTNCRKKRICKNLHFWFLWDVQKKFTFLDVSRFCNVLRCKNNVTLALFYNRVPPFLWKQKFWVHSKKILLHNHMT